MKKPRIPSQIIVDGKRFVLSVALIATKKEGKPKLITILDPKEVVELAGGEEFTTLYLPASMARGVLK